MMVQKKLSPAGDPTPLGPSHTSPEIWVLLAHGFDAQLVTEMTTYARLAAHSVILIGLIAGPQRSELGISLNPDRTLEQLPARRAPVVVFPGGKAATTALLRDPRVHRLCEAVWNQGGQVVAASSERALLQVSGVRLTALEDRTPYDWWRDFLYAAK